MKKEKISWKEARKSMENIDAENRWVDAVDSQTEKRDFIFLFKDRHRIQNINGILILALVFALCVIAGLLTAMFPQLEHGHPFLSLFF